MSKWIVAVMISMMLGSVFAQGGVSVFVRDSVINQVLSYIGPIQGQGSATAMMPDLEYSWKVVRPRVQSIPGKGLFFAEVIVEVNGVSLNSPATGDLIVSINESRHTLDFEVKRALFDLVIPFMGKKIKVARVNILRFYPIKVSIPIPDSYSTQLRLGSDLLDVRSGKRYVQFHKGRIEIGSDVRILKLKGGV